MVHKEIFNQTRKTNWIITVVHRHHHWNLQSHHQHRRSSSSPSSSLNAKTILLWNGLCELYSKPILLWKWFPDSAISSSTLSFIIITVFITVPKCQNHFAVEMVSVSCTPKPFCCCGNGLCDPVITIHTTNQRQSQSQTLIFFFPSHFHIKTPKQWRT